MTVEQWAKQQKDRIDQFTKYWMKNSVLKPDEYPVNMDFSVYNEQFWFFLSEFTHQWNTGKRRVK
jgi:hypothetical protein